MIDKKKINACAENIVKCVKVSENDCVYIRGGIYCQELLEEVALSVLRKGGLPHISSSSDNYAETIYQDDKCMAVLDINPAAPGHMLLLSKEHYMIMSQAPKETRNHMFKVCKQLSQVALRALKAQGTTVIIQNGQAAGQKAPHFMIHIIPRMEGEFTQKSAEEVSSNLIKLTVSQKGLTTIKPRIKLELPKNGAKEVPADLSKQALSKEDLVIKTSKRKRKL